MLDALVTAAALTIPADQWSSLFNQGHRWPSCTVTYSADRRADTKPLRRAIRDIRRHTGIRFVRSTTPQVRIVQRDTESPASRYFVAQAQAFTLDGLHYTTGTVIGWKWLPYWGKRYQRHVWTHELGHILGLGHTKRRGIMSTRASSAVLPEKKFQRAVDRLYPEC